MMITMRAVLLPVLFLAIASIVTAQTTNATAFKKDNGNCNNVPVYLVQEGSKVQSGSVLSTPQTVEQFYGYNFIRRTFSEHKLVKPFMGGKTTILTIHQDSNTCELSLVIVHSKAFAGDLVASISMYINGDLWDPLVKDDPEYTRILFGDDEYDSIFLRRSGKTRIRWFWGFDETDGMANPLPSPDWKGCIEIDTEFMPTTEDPFRDNPIYGHIENWRYVSGGDDGEGSYAIDLEKGERQGLVYLCVGDSGGQKAAEKSDPFPENCDESTIRQGLCGYCQRNLCHWHILCNMARFVNCLFGTEITLWD